MPIPITMPALSPTMEEGNLTQWLKKEGDEVKSGDVIAEIETDKATMEVEAADDGTLGKILVKEGTEGVPVNKVIAVLLEEGEDESDLEDFEAEEAGGEEKKAKDEDKEEEKEEEKEEDEEEEERAEDGEEDKEAKQDKEEKSKKDEEEEKKKEKAGADKKAKTEAPAGATRLATEEERGGRIFSTPIARRMAKDNNIDLDQVPGSGPHGRIVKADIKRVLESGLPHGAGLGAPAHIVEPAKATTEIPLTNMRKVIAKRLLESKQTIPHFYLTVDCEIDDLLKARKAINDKAPEDDDGNPAYKISVNDMVIKAVAMALRDRPDVNASWGDDHIVRYNAVDISVAVATEGGLITPIVKFADQKDFVQISHEMQDLAKRARDNKLKPDEYQGGSFSISNMGMYGVREFSAIINPPQSGILAVGTGEERPVVRDGELVVRTVMSCTFSFDHRVVDGAIGAEFSQVFKGYIENPITMLI